MHWGSAHAACSAGGCGGGWGLGSRLVGSKLQSACNPDHALAPCVCFAAVRSAAWVHSACSMYMTQLDASGHRRWASRASCQGVTVHQFSGEGTSSLLTGCSARRMATWQGKRWTCRCVARWDEGGEYGTRHNPCFVNNVTKHLVASFTVGFRLQALLLVLHSSVRELLSYRHGS